MYVRCAKDNPIMAAALINLQLFPPVFKMLVPVSVS